MMKFFNKQIIFRILFFVESLIMSEKVSVCVIVVIKKNQLFCSRIAYKIIQSADCLHFNVRISLFFIYRTCKSHYSESNHRVVKIT